MGKSLLETLNLSDEELERLESGAAGESAFDDPPDRSWCVLNCQSASAKTSGAGNLCFESVYRVDAWPTALASMNCGAPFVYNNGGLLVHPGNPDLVGQPPEAAAAHEKRSRIYVQRLIAHGPPKDSPLWSEDLTLEVANDAAASLVGSRVVAQLRVFPAGSTYEVNGETRTRNKTKFEIHRIERANDANMAKRGIEAAPF